MLGDCDSAYLIKWGNSRGYCDSALNNGSVKIFIKRRFVHVLYGHLAQRAGKKNVTQERRGETGSDSVHDTGMRSVTFDRCRSSDSSTVRPVCTDVRLSYIWPD